MSNKIKQSNHTVRDMYRDLFTKHLEVEMHVQDTCKPLRVGLVQQGQQQNPEFSILALSILALSILALSKLALSILVLSIIALSSCGSPVQERTKKCPGKKSQASQMKIPNKEKEIRV